MNTTDDALRALVARGFRYVRAPGYKTDDVDVDFTLLYVFAWKAAFIDAVHVRAEDDVKAVRARSDGASLDLFALENIVWAAEGSLIETVVDLLAVPEPGSRGAPARLRRAPSRLWSRGDGSPVSGSSSALAPVPLNV
jgi:hypothetical protein